MPNAPGVSVQAGAGQVTSNQWGGGPDPRSATVRSQDGSSSTTVTAGPNGQAWASGGGAYRCPNGAAVTVTSGPNGTTTSCGGAAQGVWASAGDGQARSGVIPEGRAYGPQGVAYREPARIGRRVVQHTRVRHVGRAHHHRRHRA
jgi:hypothetical protein